MLKRLPHLSLGEVGSIRNSCDCYNGIKSCYQVSLKYFMPELPLISWYFGKRCGDHRAIKMVFLLKSDR